MSVKPLFNHIELNFWQFIIPLMQESKLVKTILPWFLQLGSNLWDVKPILIIYLFFMSGATFIFLIDLIR